MGNVAIKARAPSRIGIGGGGSDLPSFFEQNGGAVLNVAINLFSYTKITKNGVKATRVISHDWGIEREFDDLELEFDLAKKDNLDIVKAAMAASGLDPKGGYELTIHSMSPKNSGLAGSSALVAGDRFTYFITPGTTDTGTGTTTAVYFDPYIFPSPTTGSTTGIAYFMESSGLVNIRIYNEIGKLVDSRQESVAAGSNGVTINVNDLAPGVYFCLLKMSYDDGTVKKYSKIKFAVIH